jgi:hypothetical protein
MIEEGKKGKVRHWGQYEVKKIVTLETPVKCYSDEIGEVDFNPTIVKIEWKKVPSDDRHELWFRYWTSVEGQEIPGRSGPMIGQKALLELLGKAIDNDFFTDDFLKELRNKISMRIEQFGH